MSPPCLHCPQILDSGNHYSKMMALQDDFGNKIFKSIEITLVRTTILCQNVARLTFRPWIVVRRCAKTASARSIQSGMH